MPHHEARAILPRRIERDLTAQRHGEAAAARGAWQSFDAWHERQRADFGLDRRLRMRTWRTERHRLTLYDGQRWGELYDLKADPLELKNRWADPAASALRSELTEQLHRAMIAASDDSPCPTAAA